MTAIAPISAGAGTPLKKVVKRDGRTVAYDRERIRLAIEMAFRAEARVPYPDPLDIGLHDSIESVTSAVEDALAALSVVDTLEDLPIESIQDEVEKGLMAGGHYTVARRFILYREARAATRQGPRLRLRDKSGQELVLEPAVLRSAIAEAAQGLTPAVDPDVVANDALATAYNGMSQDELAGSTVLAARSRVEQAPEYSALAARLRLRELYSEVAERQLSFSELPSFCKKKFPGYIKKGLEVGRLDEKMATAFDLERISDALDTTRDLKFDYLGIQTLYDRYLLQHDGIRYEMPQWFWMRVAMGLALPEKDADRTDHAIEFYDVLSSFSFCSSTPTLFNSGTRFAQLSSCFLTSVQDDLGDIFKAIRDNAMLSKWSGGLGNDWSNVRALGSIIKGTGGPSQGVVPFLKVANDTAIAVNQGGKRQGATCAYLETWHMDIEEFLELRKNTGDDRRRTHDMHLANWIPDLFMHRIREGGSWTLFSPRDVPDLHDLYGQAFKQKYEEYEALAESGAIKAKKIDAVGLWRRMLAMLFETGHPWLTWKDPSNIRSPQDHVGVVHSSNLCTEILLNTSADEIAVCNLGSVNLAAHTTRDGIDTLKLERTVKTAVRMLDNVIDINLYPVPEAKTSNQRHRPVGMGVMGFQDALYTMGVSYASDEAVEFADSSMELIAWHAIHGSSLLAAERGSYPSYSGSKWSKGIFPQDSIDILERERGVAVPVPRGGRLDWTIVRESVARHGMRNSNVMAIAPTATIANICGVSASIEPTYKNLFVKSNLSGEFTIANKYLVADLRRLGLWDSSMVEDLKYHDGILDSIERIPESIRETYLTAFEIEAEWLIECAARRQKWIDMGQSLNLYLGVPSGKRLHEMYMHAWEKGLKTTYYLRTLGAGGVEQSTVDINKRGLQPRWMRSRSSSSDVQVSRGKNEVCNLDGDCEACQ